MGLIFKSLVKTLYIMKRQISLCFLGICILLSSSGQVPRKKDSFKPASINSNFDPKLNQWSIEWPARIAQYDLVFKSPPVDPLMHGIPLGNGELGVLFWCEESKLIAAVNKSDLWQDAAFPGRFYNWKGDQEDLNTTLRHAGRIVIDFHYPIFSTLFLKDFNARLNLADASMNLEATSTFGKVVVKAFVDYNTGAIFLDISANFNEESPVDVALERFGSRTYSHWYRQINGNSEIGTSGTSAGANEDGISIKQELSGKNFAFGGTVIRSNSLSVLNSRQHSRRSIISLGKNLNINAQMAFSVTSPGTNDMLDSVTDLLATVKKLGMEYFVESNKRKWKTLWMRSFVDYGDAYLNNLWYLTIYYAVTSQGGKYPGRFNNGLWTWNRDVQNWNFYFHWNQQQLYWPLNAAGYHELVEPYLDYRFKSLHYAKADAKELFKVEGAWVSDVADGHGNNSPKEIDNHTPVAEIALEFWRQYLYTGDKKFLKEKALPYMIEASKFFICLFVKEEDGLYHSKEGTGYEGWIKLKDGLTELVYGRILFSTTLRALDEAGVNNIPEAKKWEEILSNMAPIKLANAGDSLIAVRSGQYKIEAGYFKDKVVATDLITPAGWGIMEKKWMPVYNQSNGGSYFGLKLHDGIFPTVPSSPVYPSGLIGLSSKEKDNNLFQAIKSTTILYSPGSTGWDPVPIVLARLGLATELEDVLQHWPERWQIYNNGWGHWGLEGEINKDAGWFFRTNKVKDAASPTKEQFLLPMWPFRHMSMESMAVFATAINESLLQSHDGIIRIAPAFPSTRSCRFTLHATGGFIVSAEVKSGVIQWMAIESKLGNKCKIQLPWRSSSINSGTRKIKYSFSGDIAEFMTKPGQIVIITPQEIAPSSWNVTQEKVQVNDNFRLHSSGNVQLGLPRMF